jgi:3-hydroxyacyl-CoA dehydrogenase
MSKAAAGVSFLHLGDVALLTLRNPPVNGLSKALRAGIVEALEKAHGTSGVRAVLLTGGDGACFSAGADIKECK